MGDPSEASIGRVSTLDRIAGALLGVHAGDALGATLEFCSWAEIRERYPQGGPSEIVGGGMFDWPAGHATDDTDLTRALLLAYLEPGYALAPGDDVVRTAADRMLDWYQGDWPDRTSGQRPVDVGGATEAGLTRYRETGDPRTSGAGEGQAGNGSLMRCIPTGLAVADRNRRVSESMALSAITHDDARCTVSCAAYNEIVAALVDGRSPEAAVGAGLSIAGTLGAAPVVQAIEYGMDMSLVLAVATGENFLARNGGGYVLDSLVLAVAAVLDPSSLEDVLVNVVRVGSDTDSNAAIAGGLLGARDGVAAIPSRWREKLQFAAEFAAAAPALLALRSVRSVR